MSPSAEWQRSFSARFAIAHSLCDRTPMSERPTDFKTVVRSQLGALETLIRLARVRARMRATMDVIARAEEKIRMVRQQLASANARASAGKDDPPYTTLDASVARGGAILMEAKPEPPQVT
jgi:hypothetical protein